MTERAEYRCVVKEYANGELYLPFELFGGDAPLAIKDKLASVDLRPGITFDEAQALARELDENMLGLAITD